MPKGRPWTRDRNWAGRTMRQQSDCPVVPALVCVLLAAPSGQRWPVLLSAGLPVGAMMAYRRTMVDRLYACWVDWTVGAVRSLMMAGAAAGDQ